MVCRSVSLARMAPLAVKIHPMLRIAFDSATEYLSVALADDHDLLACAQSRRPRGAENFLADGIAFCLKAAGRERTEIGAVIVTTGPGSFTGVRVGMAVALGFAEGLGVPAFGLDTLRALALACPQGVGRVAAVIDAKRGEIYAALYRKSPRGLGEMIPPGAYAPKAFADRVSDLQPVSAACGTGLAQLTPAEIPGADFHPMPYLAPTLLGKAAASHLSPLDPAAPKLNYLRGADAVPSPR